MHRLVLLLLMVGASAQAQAQPSLAPKAYRLPGLEHPAQCGALRRPLNPAQPAGTAIDLHLAVLPALARNRHPDPVFFFAGCQPPAGSGGQPARQRAG